MRRLFLLLFLSPLSFAQEVKNIDFSLSCKITGQVEIRTEDGKSYISTKGYEDSLKNDDVFKIKFIFNSRRDTDFYSLVINTDEVSYVNRVVGYMGSVNSEFELRGLNFVDQAGYNGKHHLDDDKLIINHSNIYTSIHLQLRRYNKNDYEMMISEGATIGYPSGTITANCMNMPSEYEEIISTIKAIEKNKWGKL